MESFTNLGEILSEIIKKAEEDGIITIEEQEFIKVVQIGFEELDNAIKDALQDHFLSQDEEELLRRKRAGIIDEAWEVITKDDVITKDEAELIQLLLKLIKRIKIK